MPTIVNPILPNILTNGTTADATQVMADFAFIISQINTNAAENGANSSITSLSGLTTPLSPTQGGTGQTALTQYSVIIGNQTAGVIFSPPDVAGTFLISNGVAAQPTFQPLTAVLTASVIESILGYTPVQQGTGVGQASNLIKIGWNGTNALKVTVDSTDEGYFVLSSTDPASSGNTLANSLAASALYDGGNRVWSPGNFQPLTVNGIGYDCFSTGTSGVEGNTYTLGGRPGTWLCWSSNNFSGTQPYRRIS